MPRASWAINRFLIFSPSISWVSVSDGWCDRGRQLHKFRILNTKSATSSRGWEPVAPVLGGAVLWGLCDPVLLLLRSGCWWDSRTGSGTTYHHTDPQGSIWIPGSGEMGFRKARGNFPGGPVVKNLPSKCRRRGFNLWSGNWGVTCHGAIEPTCYN